LVSGSKSVVQAKEPGIKAVGKTEGNTAEPFAFANQVSDLRASDDLGSGGSPMTWWPYGTLL
jgi:hypothetical protein